MGASGKQTGGWSATPTGLFACTQVPSVRLLLAGLAHGYFRHTRPCQGLRPSHHYRVGARP